MNAEKIKMKDVIVVGFALFAMFFGAGNLIFPPYLGLIAGHKWLTAFIGYLFADGGLALLGVIALTKYEGDMDLLFARVGKFLAVAMGSAILLCIGPGIAIPRTAATTYEVAILPNIGPGFNRILFSIIFFAITLALTIKPSKVVDIIGQFLTPALLVCLAVMIIKGIVTPIGEISDQVLIEGGVFAQGIKEGYQTLDALAALAFSGIIISSIVAKGYTDQASKAKAAIGAGIVAMIGMTLVYGGLAYIGATVSKKFGADIDNTELLVTCTQLLVGNAGKVLLGIIVGLACLTTAIGLTSACGNFFSRVTNNKLTYETITIIVCVVSAVLSNFGVGQIIKLAVPILLVLYPAALTITILGLFGDKIKNDNVFKFSTYTALIMSFVIVISGLLNHPEVGEMADKLPGGSLGFNWIVPVVIAGIIGYFVPSKSTK